jgi:hypothetical protein
MKIIMEKEFECYITEECEGCGVFFVPSPEGTKKCIDCEEQEDPWNDTAPTEATIPQ